MIVTPGTDTVTMDGISKVPIKVTILNNKGEPMSGQSISYQYQEGSGKVTVVRSITLSDGVSLGEYSVGYGETEQQARILIENETGLSETIIINEIPSDVALGEIIIRADIDRNDILENGLEVEATLLDTNGQPIPNHNLLFKVDKGNGGFLGFRLMTKKTDDAGKAMYRYETNAPGDVVITVESEEDKSIFSTIQFTVE